LEERFERKGERVFLNQEEGYRMVNYPALKDGASGVVP